MSPATPSDGIGLTISGAIHDIAIEAVACKAALRFALAGDKALTEDGNDVPRLLEGNLSGNVTPAVAEAIARKSTIIQQDRLLELGSCLDLLSNTLANLLAHINQSYSSAAALSPVFLKGLIEELDLVLRRRAREKRVRLRVNVLAEYTIVGRRNQLTRALLNVLDNAIKYSYYPARYAGDRFVDVTCMRFAGSDKVRISVSSYGVGILPNEISEGKIFESGYRGRLAADRDRHGSGLGLAETQRIVREHGGNISVTSERQRGDAYLTTVNLEFAPQRKDTGGSARL